MNVKILEITLDPKINSIYVLYRIDILLHEIPKAGRGRQKTLEITTKIVEIGLKFPLDKNNMKIFILYQDEIEKISLSSWMLLPF